MGGGEGGGGCVETIFWFKLSFRDCFKANTMYCNGSIIIGRTPKSKGKIEFDDKGYATTHYNINENDISSWEY